jgi:hypothetical protein
MTSPPNERFTGTSAVEELAAIVSKDLLRVASLAVVVDS